jgi:tRNA threonylcarbamoyladenosine biosynthesis protein TsaE
MAEVELDEDGLVAWGAAIGATVSPPLVLALRGDLGAGKTTLARAIARGAGITGTIPSPTYNLLIRYGTPRHFDLVHIDLYRLEHEEEVRELGWSEIPGPSEVVMIEWPARAERLLPVPRWEISLDDVDGGDARRVRVSAVGDPAPIIFPEARP